MLLLFAGHLFGNKTQLLTDNEGRQIYAEILNKNDVSVLIRMEGEQTFIVPLDKFDSATTRLIEEWKNPIDLIYKTLDDTDSFQYEFTSNGWRNASKFYHGFYSKRAFTIQEIRKKKQYIKDELSALGKEYGIYEELNQQGYTQVDLSLWSLMRAIAEGRLNEPVARIIAASPKDLYQIFDQIEKNWPFHGEDELKEDFQQLRSALAKNINEVTERTHTKKTPIFFISDDTIKETKTIVHRLKQLTREQLIE